MSSTELALEEGKIKQKSCSKIPFIVLMIFQVKAVRLVEKRYFEEISGGRRQTPTIFCIYT